jgi:hypothetical protein
MKKRIFLCSQLFLFSLGLIAQEIEFNYHDDFAKILKMSQNPESKLNYDKQIQRFHENDTTLTDYEMLALLIGFTDKDVFKPYSYLRPERKIYRLNGAGKFKEALELSDSLLSIVPFSAMALIEKSYSYYKLGDNDSASFYSWKFYKIMRAMAITGNGMTPETAMFSLGPADGQLFIKKALRGRIGVMGSGRDENGNFVDILEAILKDEESGQVFNATLYFQIQHATSTMIKDISIFQNLETEVSEKPNDSKKKRKNKKRNRKKKN